MKKWNDDPHWHFLGTLKPPTRCCIYIYVYKLAEFEDAIRVVNSKTKDKETSIFVGIDGNVVQMVILHANGT